jgi:hypothetical protein
MPVQFGVCCVHKAPATARVGARHRLLQVHTTPHHSAMRLRAIRQGTRQWLVEPEHVCSVAPPPPVLVLHRYCNLNWPTTSCKVAGALRVPAVPLLHGAKYKATQSPQSSSRPHDVMRVMRTHTRVLARWHVRTYLWSWCLWGAPGHLQETQQLLHARCGTRSTENHGVLGGAVDSCSNQLSVRCTSATPARHVF